MLFGVERHREFGNGFCNKRTVETLLLLLQLEKNDGVQYYFADCLERI